MEWQGSLYIDTCLCFGLRSAPKLFNVMADLLEGVTFLLHCLDDFLTMGQPGTTVCQRNLHLLIEICHMLSYRENGRSSYSPGLSCLTRSEWKCDCLKTNLRGYKPMVTQEEGFKAGSSLASGHLAACMQQRSSAQVAHSLAVCTVQQLRSKNSTTSHT